MNETGQTGSVAGEGAAKPSEGSRWVAATSYLTVFCFFALWRSKGDPFIRYHAGQGFLLLLAECIALVIALILETTIGKLKLVGLLVVVMFQLITGLGALTFSVVGFVKALFGEYWHLPLLGEYRDRVPGFHGEV